LKGAESATAPLFSCPYIVVLPDTLKTLIPAMKLSVWYLGFSENTDNGEEITRQVFSTFEHEVVTTKNEKGRVNGPAFFS
jgi:predicted nucleotide-binding protein (sugar kinase/HSP70/actin superfamily)